MKVHNKIGTLTIIILALMSLTGCTTKTKIEEPTTTTIDLTQNTITGQNNTGELSNIMYCTTTIDECITLNRREKTGTNGFLGASASGFFLSGNNISQPSRSDAPEKNNVSSIFLGENSNTAEEIVYNGK